MEKTESKPKPWDRVSTDVFLWWLWQITKGNSELPMPDAE